MFKSKKIIIFLVILLIGVIIIPVFAFSTAEGNCHKAGGIYIDNYPYEYCYNISDPDALAWGGCKDYVNIYTFEGNGPYLLGCGLKIFGGLEKEGRCKFFSVDDAYLGGTVRVTGLGAPSILRLKNENGIYKLPVVEGSINKDDVTGEWSAEFATIDPFTSQPLVPPGFYYAGCFGDNGTADGAGLKVTITR
jgi:hypothetical protein